MAQSVKCLISAQVMNLTVRAFEPHVGVCADSREPALDPLSPFLCAPPLHTLSLSLSLSLSQNKQTLKKKLKGNWYTKLELGTGRGEQMSAG